MSGVRWMVMVDRVKEGREYIINGVVFLVVVGWEFGVEWIGPR